MFLGCPCHLLSGDIIIIIIIISSPIAGTLMKSLTLFICLRVSNHPWPACVEILGTLTPTPIRPGSFSLYLQYLTGFCLVSQLCPVADPVWVGRVGKWSKCSRRELFSIFPPPPPDSPAPSPCSVTPLLSSSPDEGQDPPPGLLSRS